MPDGLAQYAYSLSVLHIVLSSDYPLVRDDIGVAFAKPSLPTGCAISALFSSIERWLQAQELGVFRFEKCTNCPEGACYLIPKRCYRLPNLSVYINQFGDLPSCFFESVNHRCGALGQFLHCAALSSLKLDVAKKWGKVVHEGPHFPLAGVKEPDDILFNDSELLLNFCASVCQGTHTAGVGILRRINIIQDGLLR